MAADEAPSFPERVGRYELLLPLGTGGMATVYLARVAVVGDVHREVALKLLHPFMHAEGREATSALIDEAKLAVRIRHPNVVPVLEVGDSPHGLFLVLEYVEGDTLSGLYRALHGHGEALPLPIVGRILVDALAGLHAAHELRDDDGKPLDLVHRDFSPQNILVGVDGVSRLTDFGVAKAAGRLNVTSSGIIKGKVAYMSPEQALGKRVDRRCDVWAAGVVAWEMLAGQRLYRQEDQIATLLKIVNEPPPRVSTVRPDIPKELDDVIADALATEVERRIPTAAELRRRWLEAAKAAGGLADPHEVGEFVRAKAGTKIQARREQASRVIKLRARVARGSAAPPTLPDGATSSPGTASLARGSAEAPTLSAGATPSVGTARSVTDDSTSAISASGLDGRVRATPRKRALGPRIGLAASALALLGAGGWLATRRRDATREPVVPTPAASATRQVASVAPEPLPSSSNVRDVAPAASVPVPTAGSVLRVEASAPIQRLEVNGRKVSVAAPTRSLEVALEPDERGRSLRLHAVATDQRTAGVTVDAGVATAHVDFATKKATPPARRAPAGSGEASDLPGLAPTPYAK